MRNYQSILAKLGFSESFFTEFIDIVTKTFSREAIFILLNSLINALGGLLFWFIATRRFPSEIIGLATAGSAIVILIANISQLGLGVGIVRFLHVLGPRRKYRLIWIFCQSAIIAIIIGYAFGWLVTVLSPGLQPVFVTHQDLWLFAISCAAWSLSTLFDAYLIARRLVGLLVIDNLVTASIRLTLVLIVQPNSAIHLITIVGFSGLLGVIAVTPKVFHLPLFFDVDSDVDATAIHAINTRDLLSFSLWNYLVLLIPSVSTQIMPSIILTIVGSTEAAAYFVTWSLCGGLLMIPSALSQALLAIRASDLQKRAFMPINGLLFSLSLLVLILLFLPAALIVLIIIGPTYFKNGWPLLIVLLLGFFPYSHALLLQVRIRLNGSQSQQAAAFFVTHSAIVLCSVPLLNNFGVIGAAWAWSWGQLLLFIILKLSERSCYD